MKRQFQIAKGGVTALIGFARVYPWTLGAAVLSYAAFSGLLAAYLSGVRLYGWTGTYLVAWAGTLPQTILLAPVWTALLRFIILREQSRRYAQWDHRFRRVLLVMVVMSAVMMIGGLLFALTLDLLPRFPMRLLYARGILLSAFCAKFVSWWLVMRLAIAPAMAAAGTRKYPLDTAYVFTRGWLWTIFGTKLIIYGPLFVLNGVLMFGNGAGLNLQANLIARPTVAAFLTLVTALVELIDAGAMGLIAVRVVQARKVDADGDKEP